MITDNAINLYIQSLKAILQNKKHCLTEVFKNWKMTPLGFSLFFLGGGGGGVGGGGTVGCFPTAWVFYPSPTKADDSNWAPLPKNEVLLHKIKTTHPLKNEGQKHSKEWLLEMIHLCICFTYKTTLKKVDSYYTRLLVLTWSI